MMSRIIAESCVSYVVDDSLNGRDLGADLSAVVRNGHTDGFRYRSVLVGWQCGFEPMFVAVHSYLDCRLGDDDAEELAKEFLIERGWFGGDPVDPDYLIR